MSDRPKYVSRFSDRFGKDRWLFRKGGYQQMISPPNSHEFLSEYDKAIENANTFAAEGKTRPIPSPAQTIRLILKRLCARAKGKGVPYDLTFQYVRDMFEDQQGRCAVSGIKMQPLNEGKGVSLRDPFSISVDRINPVLGYTIGNIRLTCLIVNVAMNNWGVDPLFALAKALNDRTWHERQSVKRVKLAIPAVEKTEENASQFNSV